MSCMTLWRGSLKILKQNKVLSLLGIAMKGHRLVSGEYQTLEAIRKGSAMLVIIAEDASDNTRKLFSDKCSFYQVPVVFFGKKAELGRAIGKEGTRSSMCICDAGLAKAVIGQLEQNRMPEGGNGGKHGETEST